MSFAGLCAIWLALDAGVPAPATTPDAGVPPPRAWPATPKPPAPVLIPASAKAWGALAVPSKGASRSIGGTSSGCLQGAATLPPSGPGYEAMRLKRNRRYGHPTLIAFIRRMAAAAKKAKLGLVAVGDLSQPRGGPTPSGHRSHQTGLDADVGYAAPVGARPGMSASARERLSAVTVVDLKTHEATPAWGKKAIALLALAAGDPAVDRIFVNPAVKRMLCTAEDTKSAPWQAHVRPWHAHHDHFHVRLKCPADSPACMPQDPPKDDGCGPSLNWWFGGDAEATRAKRKPPEEEGGGPKVPEGCAALLETPAKELLVRARHAAR